MMYTIISSIDYQEFGTFRTLKEAKARVRELKRFDKEQGNPFDENYQIVKEEEQ